MMEWLWGHKTVALFDVWSIEHVLAGLSIGAGVMKATDWHLVRHGIVIDARFRCRADIVGVLCVSFLWETAEHYLELGLFGGAVERWFAGVEMWANRLITDPLLVLFGFMILRRYPGLVWPARMLSAAWLIAHIVVFPHSMYLHDLFGI